MWLTVEPCVVVEPWGLQWVLAAASGTTEGAGAKLHPRCAFPSIPYLGTYLSIDNTMPRLNDKLD